MAALTVSTDQVEGLKRKILDDPDLDASPRAAISRLRPTADPALTMEKLQRVALLDWHNPPRHEPAFDLARVVMADTFFHFHLDPLLHSNFITARDFIAYVSSKGDPGSWLLQHLSPEPVVFAFNRSWLTPYDDIAGLAGDAISTALELEKDPPFVLFKLSAATLREASVSIRVPRALDAAPGPNFQWRQGGPLSGVREYVDGDIPRSCVTDIEWIAK